MALPRMDGPPFNSPHDIHNKWAPIHWIALQYFVSINVPGLLKPYFGPSCQSTMTLGLNISVYCTIIHLLMFCLIVFLCHSSQGKVNRGKQTKLPRIQQFI